MVKRRQAPRGVAWPTIGGMSNTYDLSFEPSRDKKSLRRQLQAERLAMVDRHQRAVHLQQVLRVWLVGRTETSPCSKRPACMHSTLRLPVSGSCLRKRRAMSSFSAQIWPSMLTVWRSALRLSEPVACSPAMSAMAVMPKATRTSIRVKPRCELDPGAGAVKSSCLSQAHGLIAPPARVSFAP